MVGTAAGSTKWKLSIALGMLGVVGRRTGNVDRINRTARYFPRELGSYLPASATLSAGWSGKQDFLRAVGGGETASNNGMITRPPKDDRLSGLVLDACWQGNAASGECSYLCTNRTAISGDRENAALR